MFNDKLWIRGAGDLATGVAIRLYRAGFKPIMSDIAVPTTVRRTVAFSPAIYETKAEVEGIRGELCDDISKIDSLRNNGIIPIFCDEHGDFMRKYKPDIIVDAIMAKKNLGTSISDAKIVVAIGPGFNAGVDCHAVVETKRGHTLGRVIKRGYAIPNTGIPGEIAGHSEDRIIRATVGGSFTGMVKIGAVVKKGDVVGKVGDIEIFAGTTGVVRGLLQNGVEVAAGMKSGDIDPRGEVENCFTVSDKALSIGGGVLEAVLSMM